MASIKTLYNISKPFIPLTLLTKIKRRLSKTKMPVFLPRNQPRKALPASSGMHKKNIHEKLQKIMKKLREADRDNNGSFNKSDVKEILKELGAYFPGWRADRAFGKADDNNDGLISGEEIDTLLEYLTSCGFGK